MWQHWFNNLAKEHPRSKLRTIKDQILSSEHLKSQHQDWIANKLDLLCTRSLSQEFESNHKNNRSLKSLEFTFLLSRVTTRTWESLKVPRPDKRKDQSFKQVRKEHNSHLKDMSVRIYMLKKILPQKHRFSLSNSHFKLFHLVEFSSQSWE